MIVQFLCVLCVARLTEQRRTDYVPRTMMSTTGSAVYAGSADDHPYNITTSSDFDLIPRNLTGVLLVFSAGHRVAFDRGTLPRGLGGPSLERLQMSVRYAPGRLIPSGFFVNLARLRSITLYHDDPAPDFSLKLSDGAFEGLTEVVELVLAGLGIEDLPAGLFRDLHSVRHLNLGQNQLAVIESGVFRPSPAPTSAGSPENHCCRNLTTLWLGENRFGDVADIRLSGLTSLRKIDLHKNNISNLHRGSFGLDGRAASTSAGGFANVEELNLDYNVIGNVTNDAFEPLVQLRTFYLAFNMLRNVTASAFSGLPALETLDLDKNFILTLGSGIFASLTSLRKLVLSENAIDAIQTGAFNGLAELRLLKLSDNRLSRLSNDTFRGLGTLEELDVSGNRLVEVAPRALAPVARSLIRLDLSENRLRTVDLRQLDTAERLSFVRLANNPWTCDCRLRRPEASGVSGETLRAAWDGIVCELPPDARGELLSSVLGQNYTVVCGGGPADDFGDRWWIYVGIALVVLSALCVSAAVALIVGIHGSRRSKEWSPRESVDAGGSSETSSSSTEVSEEDNVAHPDVAIVCDKA